MSDDAKPDVTVQPGLPGRADPEGVDGGVYPNTTTDIVKLLREQDLRVEYVQTRDQRSTLTLKAAEWWIPILVFAYQVDISLCGTLLANAVAELFPDREPKPILHVKCGRETADQQIDWFEADGPSDKVIEALREWRPTDS